MELITVCSEKIHDEKEDFLQELIKLNSNIKFHILVMNNTQPKWNYDFYKEIMISKMALNLSEASNMPLVIE